ncbi:Vam6 vps39-like, partial [Haematococcus lacustris]
VLELLPDGVPLHLMLPWVEAVVQAGTQAKRNMAVVKHLRRAENLAVREELARLKSGRVVLSSERACCLCFKRIGPAVFVAYPDMTLAHYLCHKRSQPSAAHVPGAGNLLGGSGLSAGLSLAGLVGSAGLPANGRKATSRPYTGGYAGGNDGYDYPDLL